MNIMGKQYIVEPQIEIPVKVSVEVLVVGTGPAGLMAEQAASDDSLNVTLIEGKSFLGGNLTIG